MITNDSEKSKSSINHFSFEGQNFIWFDQERMLDMGASLFDALPEYFYLVKSYKTNNNKLNSIGVSKIKPLPENITEYKGITINRNSCFKMIVVDIDYSWYEAFKKAKEINLIPNYIIMNSRKEKGQNFSKAHFIYILKNPVFERNTKAMAYFRNMKKYLTYYLDGDKRYNNSSMKNPWYKDFTRIMTRQDLYSLDEIKVAIPDETRCKVYYDFEAYDYIEPKDVQVGSRNASLFKSMSYSAWCFKGTGKYNDYNDFHKNILEESIHYNNNFSEPMILNRVRATAKSIAGYVWNTEGGKKIMRGAMKNNLPKNMSIKDKQILAGQYSATSKAEKTFRELKVIFHMYKNRGHAITKRGLHRYSGKSLTTVNKYWGKIIDPNITTLGKQELIFPVDIYMKTFTPNTIIKTNAKKDILIEKYKTYLETINKTPENKTAIATFAGVDVKTVRKYWNDLTKVKKAFDKSQAKS